MVIAFRCRSPARSIGSDGRSERRFADTLRADPFLRAIRKDTGKCRSTRGPGSTALRRQSAHASQNLRIWRFASFPRRSCVSIPTRLIGSIESCASSSGGPLTDAARRPFEYVCKG